VGGVLTGDLVIGWRALSARDGKQPSSYMPVDLPETFSRHGGFRQEGYPEYSRARDQDPSQWSEGVASPDCCITRFRFSKDLLLRDERIRCRA
jgi:hypothetical protein